MSLGLVYESVLELDTSQKLLKMFFRALTLFFQEERAFRPHDLPILISFVYYKRLDKALLLAVKLQMSTKLR